MLGLMTLKGALTVLCILFTCVAHLMSDNKLVGTYATILALAVNFI